MRDMTENEYRAALKRAGCKPTGIGRLWIKCDEFPNVMFGTIYDPTAGKIARRATIKKLHKDMKRQRDRAKAKGGAA